MMAKDMTTSEFDFFQLEEVSNETAEAISGGVTITGGIEIDPLADVGFPVDLLNEVLGSVSELTGLIGLPSLTEVVPIDTVTGLLPEFPGLPTY